MNTEEYEEISLLTLRAVAEYLNETGTEPERCVVGDHVALRSAWAASISVDGYLDTMTTWTVMIAREGSAVITRDFHMESSDGGWDAPSLSDEHTFTLEDVSPRRFAELICETILGVGYIPLKSRRQVSVTEEVAWQDATFVYAHGVAQATEEGSYEGILELDEPEAWSALEQAAAQRMGHPIGHMREWRKAGVPFYVYNVYDDRYMESAVEMMSGGRRGK